MPNRRSFREAVQVTLHDLHLSKYKPPQTKYNGAQRLAYTAVVLMGAGSLLTGLAIYKSVQFAWLTALLGGYEWARLGTATRVGRRSSSSPRPRKARRAGRLLRPSTERC
jgi:Ni,Fe-hydrogenase I cytochrome b subunit